jgi:ABC-type polysaccharide/polyol phosphate transport system ATPase subunit
MATTPVPAVLVDGVTKNFRIPRERVHTLKERVLHPLRRNVSDELRALREVSFGVLPGEFFGVVGRNGSGKSTLLKCMTGIYGVDGGQIFVNGRVSAFIELGVGFNHDLAAVDNILINATMLGLSPREARDRVDKILDFAELQNFRDLKLKNYSSGMLVRLAFSVMIQVDADILLIDEVLAVGDAAFQQKCYEEFARIRREGTTVVLVTHDMAAVERFCDRAILLEHGRLVEEGPAREVGRRYLELNFSAEARAREALEEVGPPEAGSEIDAAAEAPDSYAGGGTGEEGGETRKGDGRAEIEVAWFENDAGERLEVLPGGEAATFVMHVRFSEDVQDPLFGLILRNGLDQMILARNTERLPPSGLFRAGEEVDVRFRFSNYLAPDRYQVTAAVARAGSGLAWIDSREGFMSIVVTTTEPTGALVDLPCEIDIVRGALVGHSVS